MKGHSNLILQNHKVDHPPTKRNYREATTSNGNMGVRTSTIKMSHLKNHFTTFLIIWYSGCDMTYIWSPSDRMRLGNILL